MSAVAADRKSTIERDVCGYCLEDVELTRADSLAEHKKPGGGQCKGSNVPLWLWPGQVEPGYVITLPDNTTLQVASPPTYTAEDMTWLIGSHPIPTDQQVRLWTRGDL